MKPFDPRLLRLVPESRPAIAGLFALGAIQGLAAIGQAFAVSALVVAVVQGAEWGVAGVATVLTFGVRGAAAGLAEALAARAGTRVSSALRRRLLLLPLSRDLRERDGSARLLTLASQGATSVEPYVARYLPTLANAVVLPPAAILAMLLLDWRTGLIPILTVPLLPLFAALIGSATAKATQQRWRTLTRLSGHFLDVMRGLPTLVNYGRADRQTATIREVSHEHRRATVTTLRLAFVSSVALELLATISVAMVAVWVGIQLAEGDMALALAMPLILLAPEAYWPIRRVGAEFHNAADGAAALEDMAAQLGVDDAPDRPDAGVPAENLAAASSPLLRLASVSYAYGGAPVLHDLDAELPVPGLTVITGPSGAGKTTLLEVLAGLRRPNHGRIEAPPAHLVTQRPFLAAESLRANLLLGVGSRGDRGGSAQPDERVHAALSAVGLDDMVRSLPDGLDTPLGDDGFGLSAGQRARVALARAILADPALLLLDEPTAHLDAAAESLIEEVVSRLALDRAVVAVTHREGLVARADRHLVLRGGQ